jgi:hypothetical protein
MIDALEAQRKGDRLMKKNSPVRVSGSVNFKESELTIGLDLGDRWSFYCVLDEAGEVILEQKLPTTPEAMKQTFERIPRSRIALETGTHSPWVSRLLLVQGAHYNLGPFGEDSDLRRWGLKLAERGGKNAKKRAVVAVARKLAVLLHRLWVSGEVYKPLRNSHIAMSAVA